MTLHCTVYIHVSASWQLHMSGIERHCLLRLNMKGKAPAIDKADPYWDEATQQSLFDPDIIIHIASSYPNLKPQPSQHIMKIVFLFLVLRNLNKAHDTYSYCSYCSCCIETPRLQPPPTTNPNTHTPSKSQGIAPSAKVSSDSACNFGHPFFSIPSDNDAMLEFSNSPLCPPNSVLIVLVCWLFDLPPKISDKKNY